MITLSELCKKLGMTTPAVSWKVMRKEFPLPDILGAKCTGWTLTPELEALISQIAEKHHGN